MRKQLVIGISILALTGLGGVSENYVSTKLQGASPQYTHFVRTSLNQTFESLSGASLDIGLPNRVNYQTAGVHFIVGDQGTDFGNDDAKNNDFSDPSGDNCKRLGYSVTSCASGLFNSACPYNDKIYDRCCDVTYKYTSSQCSSPKKLSSDSCGGKYRCYCDTATYPYASCNSPQIKGSSCTDDTGTRYATCTCPGSVATPYGCETYYASPCNSVCQKAYADNCRNRTSVQTPYGCETYFSDCKSKCQKAYTDNCRNQTAVISSCPKNADCTYFADCKSKVQSWNCKSGFVKSGNTCEPDIKSRACQYVGDILYEDKSCAISANELDSRLAPIGVVFDTVNRLAVALTQSDAELDWGGCVEWDCSDLPGLENCTHDNVLSSCGIRGKENTQWMISYGQAHNISFPAAEYCYNYITKGTSKGEWFLPSAKELYLLHLNKAKVNSSLDKLGSKIFSGSYQSSVEMASSLNIVWVSSWNKTGNTAKYNGKITRPIIYY